MSDLSNNIMNLATVGLTAGIAFKTIDMINNMSNNTMPQSRRSKKIKQPSYYDDDIFSMPFSGKKKKRQSYDFELF